MTQKQIIAYLQRKAYRDRKSGKTASRRRAERALVRKYNLSK